jgi:hypothetical protein
MGFILYILPCLFFNVFLDLLRHLYIILFYLVQLFLVLGFVLPCLAVVKHANNLIELNYYYYYYCCCFCCCCCCLNNCNDTSQQFKF